MIPLPIVAPNRATIVVVELAQGQPLLTTTLFVVLAVGVVLGPGGRLIFPVGERVLRRRVALADGAGQTEAADRMRFNNSITVAMPVLRQVAFLVGQPFVVQRILALVAIAATVAIARFCVGCSICFRLGRLQSRLRSGRAG